MKMNAVGGCFGPLNSIDPNILKKAQDELSENETIKSESICEMRKWIQSNCVQNWLVSPTERTFILSFLRNRKYKIEEAKERISMYWKIRSENLQWFADIDVHNDCILRRLKKGIFQPLPKRTSQGSVIVLVQLGLVEDKTVLDFDYQIKAAVACTDYLLCQEETQISGIEFIYDLADVSLGQVFTFGEERIKRLTSVWLKTYPVRFKAIHYYNLGPVFEIIIKLLKQVLSKKLRQRIFTHKHLLSLYKKVDKELLPLEYLPDDHEGRNAGSLSDITKEFVETITEKSARDYILGLSNGQFWCDYKHRPKDPFNVPDS